MPGILLTNFDIVRPLAALRASVCISIQSALSLSHIGKDDDIVTSKQACVRACGRDWKRATTKRAPAGARPTPSAGENDTQLLQMTQGPLLQSPSLQRCSTAMAIACCLPINTPPHWIIDRVSYLVLLQIRFDASQTHTCRTGRKLQIAIGACPPPQGRAAASAFGGTCSFVRCPTP